MKNILSQKHIIKLNLDIYICILSNEKAFNHILKIYTYLNEVKIGISYLMSSLNFKSCSIFL